MLRDAAPTPRMGYSRQEVADAFGVSHGMIIDLCRRGGLPTFKLGAKVFVPAEAIELLIERAMTNFRPDHVMARLVGLSEDPRDIARRRPA